MPFAGDAPAAADALATLRSLKVAPGDELILADNSGTALTAPGVTIVRAGGERSPAHARNRGAAAASNEWILFIDADCSVTPSLLDLYFRDVFDNGTGAVAGEIAAAVRGGGVAERYAASKGFLGASAHLAHPYRPRAAAANLLVRAEAFRAVGGFYEGLRAAEDTDFCWRLQAAGWKLEARPEAIVMHRYRATLRELRAQWRGYAAGRAWLARRYPGFTPEPALARAARRAVRRGGQRAPASPAGASPPSRLDRARFLAIDGVLAADELAGFALSNRPAGAHRAPAAIVLVTERFPVPGDPLVEYARSLASVRVEAAARPDPLDAAAAVALRIDYREDDGVLVRLRALTALLLRRPLRALIDRLRRGPGPSLLSLAPAVARLRTEPGARVHALGGDRAQATAARLAALSGGRAP
jgi:hypothetical protein